MAFALLVSMKAIGCVFQFINPLEINATSLHFDLSKVFCSALAQIAQTTVSLPSS